MMPTAEFDALVVDLRNNGQRDAIMVLDGMILDGYHRWRALRQLGEKPRTENFPKGEDPAAYVMSKNFFRRHLTDSQKAIAAVQCRAWHPEGRIGTKSTGASAPVTNAELAKEAKVPLQTIKDAKKVIEQGREDEVINGTATVASIARPPKPKKPKPPPEEEPEMPDHAEMMEEADKQIRAQQELIESLKKSDLAMELQKQQAKYNALNGRLHQCMTTCAAAEKTATYRGALLTKIRAALGVKGDSDIIPAIKALQ